MKKGFARQLPKCLLPYPSAQALLRDLLCDCIGSFLYAVGVVTFAKQANFAPGGVTGIAIIINHFCPFLKIGMLTVLINAPVAVICYRLLGHDFFVKSIKSMLISAFFLDYVAPLIPMYDGDPLLAALFAGALAGVGLAIIYIPGSSTGGTDFIIMSIQKKFPHLTIGAVSLCVDGMVILLGGLVYDNINAVLYGVLMTFVNTTILDHMLYGSGSQKMLLVISDKSDEIAWVITHELERGVTLLTGKGGYTQQARPMLFCVCSKIEVASTRKIVYRIDPTAMVMLSTVDEAYGLGFSKLEET